MADVTSLVKPHGGRTESGETASLSRAQRLRRGVLLGFALVHAPLLGLAAGTQLPLASIDQLPNAPATYQMRDWRQVAVDFDRLAFDATATGQFLPLVSIDHSPVSPQLQTSFGLAAYVGETRTFSETGERVHEALASLGAVLGGTLVGVNKSAGPHNWVAMTREYYVDRNSQFIVLNTPFSASGQSAWYDVYPNILFYSIADRYPDESSLQTILNTIDARFYSAVNTLTAGGTAPNFNYTAFNFKTQQPVSNGVWREPDMGLGMAWLQHAAYWRNRASNPTQAAAHLNAVDWSLAYYEQTSNNPDYEILAPFGAYAAARMNAEQGRNFDIQKLVKWVFSRSHARPTKTMISGAPWGGQDVSGLMGFTLPNAGANRGYAFSMNTFATAMPMVPLARYEDRYSHAIGKWMLNAASAARLFYANAHSPANQSSEFWTGDPQSSVAYEGLRHHWRDEFDGEELFAGGDPLTFGWGPLTDFSIYGSAVSGVFGSIIKTTNVEKILQLDLLATDFYRDAAHSTYLYYNPLPTKQSVAIDLGSGSLFDLYDAASNRYLARGASAQSFFDVPADEAVMLVLVPSGGAQTRQGRRLLVDGVVIDYNATVLPDNLVRNSDVDVAADNDAGRPGYWHGSQNAEWSAQHALSPTHSLKLIDDDQLRSEEWRSFANSIPAGSQRTLQLRWFWDYATADVFHARLRLSTDAASGVDLANPSATYDFAVTGTSSGFEMFEAAVPIPDNVQSFDLAFITGGPASALGALFVDDVSASILPPGIFQPIESDFNGDGIVNARDFDVWTQGFGVNFGGADFLAWQRNVMPNSASPAASSTVDSSVPVPEPSAAGLALAVAMVSAPRSAPRFSRRRRLATLIR